MNREPQLKDRVKTPKGDGAVVARSETLGGWLIAVRLDKGSARWKGAAYEVELLEAAGEQELRERLRVEEAIEESGRRNDKT